MRNTALLILLLCLAGGTIEAQRPSPGQTLYEDPEDVRVVARNASKNARAKFLVFFVKQKGAPLLVVK